MAEIFPTVKWVFPTAKLRYSAQRDFQFSNSSFAEALKGEEIISQWFDVWDIKQPEEREELIIPGLQESIAQIIETIKKEVREVSLDRIILGGISQGCATSLLTLLASGLRLGGFVGWCGWLPLEKKIREVPSGCSSDIGQVSRHVQAILELNVVGLDLLQDESPSNDESAVSFEESSASTSVRSLGKTPVFLAHARDDGTVPFAMGESLRDSVQELGFPVVWREYEDGGHWIHSTRGADDMVDFLRKAIDIDDGEGRGVT